MSRVNNEVILKDLLVATRGATKAWETIGRTPTPTPTPTRSHH